MKNKKTETTKDKGKSIERSPVKVAKLPTDSKVEAMDQKWSEHFSGLEAMLLSQSFNQPEPVFQPVVVSPAKPPPAGDVDNTQSFFEP